MPFTLSFFIVLLFSFSVSAEPLPDLIELPENLEFIPSIAKEIKATPEEISEQTLLSLKNQIEATTQLNPTHQLRLLSLIQELEGKPDQSYLTLKKIKDQNEKLWYSFKELYLADVLGLEEDTHRLAHLITEKLLLKQLKVNKIEFCNSVKGFGLYETISGPLAYQKPTIIYVEINHLKQILQAGYFKSSCNASFEIRDQQGNRVFEYSYPTPFEYQAKSPLKDYFIWMKWTPLLGAGNYTMHLKIEDIKASLSHTEEFNFEIK